MLPVRTIAWRPPVADRPIAGPPGPSVRPPSGACCYREPVTRHARRGRAPAGIPHAGSRGRGAPDQGEGHARRTLADEHREGPQAGRRRSCAGPGITADMITGVGVVMAVGAAVVHRHRPPHARPALPGAHRHPRPARRRRGQGLGHRRAPGRVLRLRVRPRHRRAAVRRRRLVPRHRPSPASWRCSRGRPRRLADRVLRAGQGRLARLRRQGRASWSGPSASSCSASACSSRRLLVPVLWLMVVLNVDHRRASASSRCGARPAERRRVITTRRAARRRAARSASTASAERRARAAPAPRRRRRATRGLGVDLVTAAVPRAAALLAARCPRPVADLTAKALSRAAATVSAERRMLVDRNLRRAPPRARGPGPRPRRRRHLRHLRPLLGRLVPAARACTPPRSTATSPSRASTTSPTSVAAGTRPILALPHLGGWEWAGVWLTRSGHAGHRGGRAARAARAVRVVPRLPSAAGHAHHRRCGPRPRREVLRALQANHVVCLLCDRDITGAGIEVEFFGERTTLPGGPGHAGAAHRRAACCPSAATSRAATATTPSCSRRSTPSAQGAARRRRPGHPGPRRALEALIRRRPSSGTCCSPTGRATTTPSGHRQAPSPTGGGPSARASGHPVPDAVRIGLVCPYSLTLPGGVQGQVLALARVAARAGATRPGCSPRATARPRRLRHPAGQQRPHRRQRLDRPDRPRPVGPAPHDPGPVGRGLRRACTSTSPSLPGATLTALLVKPAPLVGTFHAAGEIPPTAWPPVVHWMAGKLDVRWRCPRTPGPWPSHLGGEYELLFNGIELATASPRPSRGRPTGPPCSSSAATSPARASRCCWRPSRSCRPTCGCGWPATARRPRSCAARSPTTRASSGWAGCRRREDARGSGPPTCSAPRRSAGESFGVILFEAMAAVDRRSSPATSPATPRWPGPGATPCWSRRASRGRWPPPSPAC